MMMVPPVILTFSPEPRPRLFLGGAPSFEEAVGQGVIELELHLLFRFRELAVYPRGDKGRCPWVVPAPPFMSMTSAAVGRI